MGEGIDKNTNSSSVVEVNLYILMHKEMSLSLADDDLTNSSLGRK